METSNPSGSISYSSSATDPTATPDLSSTANTNTTTNDHSTSDNERRTSLSAINPTSTHPARDLTSPANPATESAPLNAHHRPSIQGDDHQGLAGETTIRQMGRSQNAPGKAGDIGENVVGALGFGGSSVQRPKEDQGLGEKIAEFLGA